MVSFVIHVHAFLKGLLGVQECRNCALMFEYLGCSALHLVVGICEFRDFLHSFNIPSGMFGPDKTKLGCIKINFYSICHFSHMLEKTAINLAYDILHLDLRWAQFLPWAC